MKYEEPTQGYDAVYQKLDKHPIGGHKICPTWFVNTSGPMELEGIVEEYKKLKKRDEEEEYEAKACKRCKYMYCECNYPHDYVQSLLDQIDDKDRQPKP